MRAATDRLPLFVCWTLWAGVSGGLWLLIASFIKAMAL
jgi:hypothetical protein